MSEPARIIGSVLVKDEDRFLGQALRNVVRFCDFIHVSDHHSRDGTGAILDGLAAEFPGKFDIHRVDHPRESHAVIRRYAGTATWVFGVDGDEIYDPAGLDRLRVELLRGDYDRSWVLFGNVLNCTAIDPVAGTARGHLAPPCRSMTKLYNFRAIEDWGGKVTLRLAAGDIRFRPGYDASLRLDLHERVGWAEAWYRCLHTCFVSRSSIQPPGEVARRNVSERSRTEPLRMFQRLCLRLTGRRAQSEWKLEKYRRGPEVELDVSAFFPPA